MGNQSRRQLLRMGGGLLSTMGLTGCLRLTSQTAETESPSTESPSTSTSATAVEQSSTEVEQSSTDLEQLWEIKEFYREAYIPEKCGIACRDTVYISGGSDSTQIRALDLANGEEVWSFQVEGDRVGVLNLTADQTNLYGLVASYDSGEASVLNLDRQTGDEIWSTDNIFYDARAELALSENRLIVSENQDRLTRITILDKESGEKGDEIGSIPNSSELYGVTTTPESLYLSANNNIYSYPFTDGELKNIAEGAANTGPVVNTTENILYQPTKQSIKRIDLTTNSLDWEADVRTVVKPVTDGYELICASASGVSSLSRSDGDTNWINTNVSITPGNFDLENRYIWYTPDGERTGHLIDATGGSTEYTFDGSVLSMDSNFQQYAVVATMDRLVGYQFDW